VVKRVLKESDGEVGERGWEVVKVGISAIMDKEVSERRGEVINRTCTAFFHS
jgi:hypothetical protein